MNLWLETARRLLAKAKDDRYILAGLMHDSSAPVSPLGFHAPQAVEKALKAVLAARAVEYPMTNNIAMLLTKLTDQGISAPPDAAELPTRTPFEVAFRHDDAGEPEDIRLDRTRALACVDRTVAWAESHMTAAEDSR
ncbi:MAG: HEPN domain-containing protein [Phycisphaerae bacterium]|nr:HEPN domain-containing protein [Phycisphaerae bacterium]